jgi:hypothetical protein
MMISHGPTGSGNGESALRLDAPDAELCAITGKPADECGCRSCEPAGQPGGEAWRMVPFLSLPGTDGA